MFTTTKEQDYLLSILRKTKFMRRDQAVRLLSSPRCERSAENAERHLEQLRHIRKIKWQSPDVFTLPFLYLEPTDTEMLSAIDVMLDLSTAGIPTAIPAAPPYKLCFTAGNEKNLGSYAVITCRPGFEAEITALLCGAQPDKRAVIFLLSDITQKDSFKTALPHYFAVRDGGKYRYFKGVV